MCHLIGLVWIVSKVLVNSIPKMVTIMRFENKVTAIIIHVVGSGAAEKSCARIFLDIRYSRLGISFGKSPKKYANLPDNPYASLSA